MRRHPPLLPEVIFGRVLRLARFDGMGLLSFAGLFAVLSAVSGDRFGAIFGLLVAGAGAIELHGTTLLLHGERRGMSWLVGSQLYLMLTVLAYCQFRFSHPDTAFWLSLPSDLMKQEAQAFGMTVKAYALQLDRTAVYMFAVATILYQGGMALYYLRRRGPVNRVLEHEAVA